MVGSTVYINGVERARSTEKKKEKKSFVIILRDGDVFRNDKKSPPTDGTV